MDYSNKHLLISLSSNHLIVSNKHMKKIVLHSITLTNWRGEKHRTTEFNADAPTYIQGGNGLGKSRHFDAFCWLLFGKDSRDRKDFELRTYDAQHNPLRHCECSVEAVISVDGERHTLKREYQEQWVKPKGQVEEVFKGNITVCTWDDVPVKVSDFQKRITSTIIDETVFKMITNPRYFAGNMKWQLQRETLLQMAGTKSDEEIASDNADFKTLLDTLDGKSLSDFRKQLALERKRLNDEKDDIEPRIDQTQKMMPEAEDWDTLAMEQDTLRKQIDDISLQLENSGKRTEAEQKQISGLQLQIYTLQGKQDAARQAYGKKLQDDADAKNEARRAIEKKCKETASAKSETSIDIRHAEDRITYLKEQIQQLGSQLDDLRKQWYEINSQKYDGSDICPHCGQRLPESMIASAMEDFEAHKRKLIGINNERGKSLSSQRKSYEEELTAKQDELKGLQARNKTLDNTMQSLYDELARHPLAKAGTYQAKDIPGWEDWQKQINDLNEQIAALSTPKTDTAAEASLRANREQLQTQYHDLQQRLIKRKQIEDGNAEIDKLNERGKELAQQIAAIEKREYIAAQFSKKKIEDCEKRINSMFHIVRFQLFDYTQDGNEFETCIPLVNGVPYAVANTASQLNAGLDIINTLCRFNNVSAPIFCDGAESVNNYISTQSQMIFLQVTTDKQLVIK